MTPMYPYLNPNSTYKNSPKPLKTPQQATILHTVGVLNPNSALNKIVVSICLSIILHTFAQQNCLRECPKGSEVVVLFLGISGFRA